MSEIVQALVELQEREGWLSPTGLEALAERLRVPLHRLESVSTFYTHFEREPPRGAVAWVCRDVSCRMAGAEPACAALREEAARRGDVEIREVSCSGRCDRAPAAAIGERCVSAADPEAVFAALEASADGAEGAAEVARPPALGSASVSVSADSESGSEALRVAESRRAWPAADPYVDSALAPFEVLRSLLSEPPATLIETLEASGLRGMGGAGFPTGRKWSLVAAAEGTPKRVICNADESEPGTFKDREILKDLPHLVIEGMVLAGLCVGAHRGTVFIRHEYGPERRRLEAAIEAARTAGALGKGLFGSGFDFELDVFVSPGGYILGEETALLECIEGRRGEPRNKPPFPGVAGLYGQPTLINNVETFVHAVSILYRGADWWASLGRPGFEGHKFVSTSGDVVRPGVELFAMGTPIEEIIAAHGGTRSGQAPLAVAPGGASSSFLGPEVLGVPLDFGRLAEAGSMLGSGAIVVVDEGRDLLDIGLSIARFFRNESCGKCVPCRVGSEKAVALLERAGEFDAETEGQIRALHETLKETSICGLGQVALSPLLSIADRFPERVGSRPSRES